MKAISILESLILDCQCNSFLDIIGKRAGELHLQLGSLFPADEAHKLGLVDIVVSTEEDLYSEADKFAQKLLKVPSKPVALTKQLLRRELLDYLEKNKERDARRFIAQVQAEQTQTDIGNFLKAMKK